MKVTDTTGEQVARLCQIVIPAGTVCEVAGLPLKFTSDTPVEGTPDELALLHSRLYPWPSDPA